MLTLSYEVAYNLETGNDLSMRVETSQIKLCKVALAIIFSHYLIAGPDGRCFHVTQAVIKSVQSFSLVKLQ